MVLYTKRAKICVVVPVSFPCEHESHTNLFAISLMTAIKIHMHPHKNTKYPLLTLASVTLKDMEIMCGKKEADYAETHVMETSSVPPHHIPTQ